MRRRRRGEKREREIRRGREDRTGTVMNAYIHCNGFTLPCKW